MERDLTIDEILKLEMKPKKSIADIPRTFKTPCHKCMGKGKLLHYHHYKGGKCFECNGTGYMDV